MKKSKYLLLILTVMLLAFVLVACTNGESNNTQSGDQEESDLVFTEKSDGTYEVSSVTDVDIDLARIPDKYNGKSVTSIGYMAFANLSNLLRVEIPNGVTHIGEYAFMNSKAEIIWGNAPNITTLGTNSFYEYKGEILNIPDTVTAIESKAFSNCTAEIKWGENPQITEIGAEAFF